MAKKLSTAQLALLREAAKADRWTTSGKTSTVLALRRQKLIRADWQWGDYWKVTITESGRKALEG